MIYADSVAIHHFRLYQVLVIIIRNTMMKNWILMNCGHFSGLSLFKSVWAWFLPNPIHSAVQLKSDFPIHTIIPVFIRIFGCNKLSQILSAPLFFQAMKYVSMFHGSFVFAKPQVMFDQQFFPFMACLLSVKLWLEREKNLQLIFSGKMIVLSQCD